MQTDTWWRCCLKEIHVTKECSKGLGKGSLMMWRMTLDNGGSKLPWERSGLWLSERLMSCTDRNCEQVWASFNLSVTTFTVWNTSMLMLTLKYSHNKTLFLTCSHPDEAPTALFHNCTHGTSGGQHNTFSRNVNWINLWKYVKPLQASVKLKNLNCTTWWPTHNRCVCVDMCACGRLCVGVCMCGRARVWACVCVWGHVCVYVSVCVGMCAYVCGRTCVCMHACMCMRVWAHVCVSVRAWVSARARACVRVCVSSFKLS